jgi:transcriptional regulator with XRE-family HTH domain
METGDRIKKLRTQQLRTLQEIADACGFTKSLLSKIENGRTAPSVASLSKIAAALGVKLSQLLEDSAGGGTLCETNKEVLAKGLTSTEKGYKFHSFASGRADKTMQPFLFVAEKGGVKGKPLSHPGEEFVFVLEGSMEYRVGNTVYRLGPGDSLYFDAVEEHDLKPVSARAVYIAVFAGNGGGKKNMKKEPLWKK